MEKIPNTRRLMTFCGFASASRQLVSGTQACEAALKSGKALLVLLSGDAAANTVKHLTDMAAWRQIPCFQLDDDALGKSIGAPERKTVCIVGKQFADVIEKEINLMGVKE